MLQEYVQEMIVQGDIVWGLLSADHSTAMFQIVRVPHEAINVGACFKAQCSVFIYLVLFGVMRPDGRC